MADLPSGNSGHGIQVIERATQILRLLSSESDGITPTTIGVRLGLARSTAHRILTALEREGFVLSDHGRYRLGPVIDQLAHTARQRFVAEIYPYLEQLCFELGETIQLCTSDGDQAIVIAQVLSRHALCVVGEIGSLRPLHCTATGKALLANCSDETVGKMLPPELIRYTESTIVDMAALKVELADVRQRGVAMSREEFTQGVCSVGAVLRHAHVGPATIAVPMPAGRFYGNEEELATRLLAHVRTIEAALGYGDVAPKAIRINAQDT